MRLGVVLESLWWSVQVLSIVHGAKGNSDGVLYIFCCYALDGTTGSTEDVQYCCPIVAKGSSHYLLCICGAVSWYAIIICVVCSAAGGNRASDGHVVICFAAGGNQASDGHVCDLQLEVTKLAMFMCDLFCSRR